MKKKHLSRLRTDAPKDLRTRGWTIIVYEDSAPEEWRHIVAEQGAQYYISPYHDRDIRADGTTKKPHWHVVFYFADKKSVQQVQRISDQLSGVHVDWEHCAVGDMRKMVRYLIHFDDADKAQYSIDQMETGGGADWLQYFEQASDIDAAVGEMMEWVDKSEHGSLAELSRYARDNRPDWFRALTAKRTQFMRAYCQAVTWERGHCGHDLRDVPECAKGLDADVAKYALSPIIARDSDGNRICVCESCGKIDLEAEFSSYGGEEYPNMGRCRDCS